MIYCVCVCVCDTALKALQERFMKHVQPAPRPKRERTLQLNVVRKDSAPSGQEELLSESITITVNEGEDEPAKVKPGTGTTSLAFATNNRCVWTEKCVLE